MAGFNPRARVGRDLSSPCTMAQETSFNPRARVGRDRLGACKGRDYYTRFNPRARVGRDRRMTFIKLWGRCFNPRARVGRDRHCAWQALTARVSIHAPAWGATAVCVLQGRQAAKFQSTRPRGARHMNMARNTMLTSAFQSTRPRGARLSVDFFMRLCTMVSIHAPAWGATCTV